MVVKREVVGGGVLKRWKGKVMCEVMWKKKRRTNGWVSVLCD
jgi:hypothetical protein